jgi:hypothetical protein
MNLVARMLAAVALGSVCIDGLCETAAARAPACSMGISTAAVTAPSLAAKFKQLPDVVEGIAKSRSQNGSGREVYLIMRVEVLVERMIRAMDRLIQRPDADSLSSGSEEVAKSLAVVSVIVEGLSQGSTELDINRVDDPQALQGLTDLRCKLNALKRESDSFARQLASQH